MQSQGGGSSPRRGAKGGAALGREMKTDPLRKLEYVGPTQEIGIVMKAFGERTEDFNQM